MARPKKKKSEKHDKKVNLGLTQAEFATLDRLSKALKLDHSKVLRLVLDKDALAKNIELNMLLEMAALRELMTKKPIDDLDQEAIKFTFQLVVAKLLNKYADQS